MKELIKDFSKFLTIMGLAFFVLPAMMILTVKWVIFLSNFLDISLK